MPLIRKQDTPSLLVNSHFSRGLFGWNFVGNVLHKEAKESGRGSFTPNFSVRIPATSYIYQRLTRPDTYSYPSRHFAKGVVGVPTGINTLTLMPQPGSVFDPPQTLESLKYFRQVIPGSQIGVRDLDDFARSDAYRVGSVNADGSAEVSPLSDPLPRKTDNSQFLGATVRTTGTTQALVTFLGRLPSNVGAGDILVITKPVFAVARITSIPTEPVYINQPVIGVSKVEHGQFITAATNVSEFELTEWFITPARNFNVFYDAQLFRYEFTVAMSLLGTTVPPSVELDLIPYVELADRVIEGTQISIPKVPVLSGYDYEIVTNSKGTNAGSPWARLLYRFLLETPEPVFGDLRLLLRAPATGEVEVGHVVLYKGDYVSRHDYSDLDGDDPPIGTDQYPANSRDALDRLFHGSDEVDSAIPKGTLIMYMGDTCPPGYKRLDSYKNSVVDGMSGQIPLPDVIYYDESRDRTVLRWENQTFNLLDSNNLPIPIEGEQREYVVSNINIGSEWGNKIETIKYGPNQSWIQPGMSVRVRASDYTFGQGRANDYSTLVRQVVVTKRLNDAVAPVYIGSNNFAAGEFDIPPVGPPGSYPANLGPQQSSTPVYPYLTGIFGVIERGRSHVELSEIPTTNPIVEGDLFYVRPDGVSGFVGLVDSVVLVDNLGADPSYVIRIRRYDGRPMVVDSTDLPLDTSFTLCTATIYPDTTEVVKIYSAINNGPGVVWSVRDFINRTEIAVNGDIVSDLLSYNSSLIIEPTGFIKFADPANFLSYGSMGHSHRITRGDAVLNKDIAPVSTGTVRPVEVARSHGHGFMTKHIYPIPPFAAYMICEKV